MDSILGALIFFGIGCAVGVTWRRQMDERAESARRAERYALNAEDEYQYIKVVRDYVSAARHVESIRQDVEASVTDAAILAAARDVGWPHEQPALAVVAFRIMHQL